MFTILFVLSQVVLYCSCYEITAIEGWKTTVGDGPHYDAKTNSLYYTDAVGEYQLLRYDLREKKIYRARIEGTIGRVGFAIPIKGLHNKFLVGMKLDLKVVKWDGKSTRARIICTQIQEFDIPTNFLHDVGVDSRNRVYVGTLRYDFCNPNVTTPPGGLFRFDNGNSKQLLVPNLLIANDFAIDECRKKLYLADSCPGLIRAYDWDPITGGVSNERIAVDFRTQLFKENPRQIPDGLVLDTEGKIWVAANGGGAVVRFDPDTGLILQKIPLPVIYTESLAFGGKNMDKLFVTTNSVRLIVETGGIASDILPPHYGTLYQITNLGVRGVPPEKLRKDFTTCALEKSFFKRFCKQCII